MRKHCPDHSYLANVVRIELATDLCLGNILDGPVEAVSGVVDEDVDVSEPFDALGDCLRNAPRIGHVQRYRVDQIFESRDDAGTVPIGVAHRCDNSVAALGADTRGRFAETAGGARDQHDVARCPLPILVTFRGRADMWERLAPLAKRSGAAQRMPHLINNRLLQRCHVSCVVADRPAQRKGLLQFDHIRKGCCH